MGNSECSAPTASRRTARSIARATSHSRSTIRRYARAAAALGWRPGGEEPSEALAAAMGQQVRPAAGGGVATTISACDPHRVWIEAQVSLGRNAVSIYQDLVSTVLSRQRIRK